MRVVEDHEVVDARCEEFGRFFEELRLHILGGDDPKQIGLQDMAKAGVDVNKVSDDKVDAALQARTERSAP